MLYASYILATDDNGAIIKLLIFGAIGVFWVLRQVIAATSSTKKTANRPRPLAPPPMPRPAAPLQPPPPPLSPRTRMAQLQSSVFTGRLGGPATSLQDARRLAQARVAQARAAQARAAQLAAVNPPPPPAPPRPAPPPQARVAAPAPPVAPAPASRRAPRAVPVAVPAKGKPSSRFLPVINAQSLRSQYILTEILAPPVSLREDAPR
jgi:hypothetical protein